MNQTSFIDYLLAPGQLLITASLMILLVLALIEGVTLALGGSLFRVVDDLGGPGDADAGSVEVGGPEVDGPVPEAVPDAEGDLEPVTTEPGAEIHVPLSIVIVLSLGIYGVTGVLLLGINHGLLGRFLPSPVLALASGLLTLVLMGPLTRRISRVFGRESTAIRLETLTGHRGHITLGTARAGQPAETRVEDRFGQDHWVRVVPHREGDELPAGSLVLLIDYRDGIFTAIPYESTPTPGKKEE